MEILCTKCGLSLRAEDINIQTDLAKCKHCGNIFKASESVSFKTAPTVISGPPVGSSILFSENNFEGTASISLKSSGFTAARIGLLLFLLFWFSFITVWTIFASFAGFFALFSIPFWIVGIGMLVFVINQIRQTQQIYLDENQITLKKIQPFFSKDQIIQKSEITDIRISQKNLGFSSYRNSNYDNKIFIAPAIISGKGNIYFFENANEAERDWAIQYLLAWLRK